MVRGEIVILSSPSPEDNQRTAFKIPLYFLKKSPVFQAIINHQTGGGNPILYDDTPAITVDDTKEDLRELFATLYGQR